MPQRLPKKVRLDFYGEVYLPGNTHNHRRVGYRLVLHEFMSLSGFFVVDMGQNSKVSYLTMPRVVPLASSSDYYDENAIQMWQVACATRNINGMGFTKRGNNPCTCKQTNHKAEKGMFIPRTSLYVTLIFQKSESFANNAHTHISTNLFYILRWWCPRFNSSNTLVLV